MFKSTKIIKSIACDFRLRILFLLLNYSDGLCVGSIENILEEKQYNVSKHLRILLESGLVENYKIGKSIIYKLNNKNDNKVYFNFIKNLELDKMDVFKNDLKKLNKFVLNKKLIKNK